MGKRRIDYELQTGDQLLTFSGSTVSKVIRLGMDILRKKDHKPPMQLYSHVATALESWGEKFVGEAIGRGYFAQPFEKTYAYRPDHVLILTPVNPLNKEQKEKICKEAFSMAGRHLRYGFADTILWQPLFILTGEWLGKSGEESERAMNCSEAGAHLANIGSPGTCPHEWMYNPYMFLMNMNYKVVYPHVDIDGWRSELKHYYERTNSLKPRDRG